MFGQKSKDKILELEKQVQELQSQKIKDDKEIKFLKNLAKSVPKVDFIEIYMHN